MKFGISVEVSSGIEKINFLGILFSVEIIEKNIDFNDIQYVIFVEIVEFNILGSDIIGGGFFLSGQLLLCDYFLEKCIVCSEDGMVVQEIFFFGVLWDVYFEFDG